MILLSNEVMSALHTPVSYTSGSSSELSETASTEENKPRDNKGTSSVTSPINSSVSRIPTIWKRMRDSTHDKDAESKRPPWRAVSISTLPKPDKNALLRAKLLDASRRLRATKIAVGVQTDIVPSKLMKDVALGPQTNLILLKDFGVLTDGSYTKRRDGTTEYILTYSVAQMTDSVKRETVSTQTLIPRLSGDAFLEACSLPVPLDQLAWSQCTPTEKILLKKFINMRDYFIPVTAHFKEKNMHSKRTDNDLHAATVTIKYPNQTLGCNTYSPNKLYHTEFSWNFEYDSDYIEYAKQLSSYTTKNNAHKSSLAPCGEQNSSSLRYLSQFLDDLIDETITLADLIQLKTLQSKINSWGDLHVREENVKKEEANSINNKLPSKHWVPIIDKQEEVLANLKTIKLKNMHTKK